MTAPPRRRTRRGRGWIVLGVILVLLLGAATVVDRVAASMAADRIATKLGEHAPFTSAPTVRVHGFPFLTQAAGGTYRDIEVSGNQISLPLAGRSEIADLDFDAHLHGVHLALSDALNGSVTRLPVDRIDGTVVVPYPRVGELTNGALKLSGADGKLYVTGSVALPGVGTVSARGAATIALSGGRLVTTIGAVTINGQAVPDEALTTAQRLLTVALDVPTLPYQLRLTEARATAAGLRIGGEVRNIVLLSPAG